MIARLGGRWDSFWYQVLLLCSLVLVRYISLTVLSYLFFGLPGLAVGLIIGAAYQLRLIGGIMNHWPRDLYPEAREDLRPVVRAICEQIGVAAPPLILADQVATDGTQNCLMAFNLFHPRRDRLLVVERDWIDSLPQPVMAAVLTHELGHLTRAVFRIFALEWVLALAIRPTTFALAALMVAAGNFSRFEIASALVALGIVVDLIRMAVSRRGEYRADLVAFRAGAGSELYEWLGWAQTRLGDGAIKAAFLSTHPTTAARRDRLAKLLQREPDATPSLTFDGYNWSDPEWRKREFGRIENLLHERREADNAASLGKMSRSLLDWTKFEGPPGSSIATRPAPDDIDDF